MNAAIQYVKANAVLLALVGIALFQQSEIKEMERTLNYIYSVVQACLLYTSPSPRDS